MKFNFKEIVFWIVFIFALVLLIWNVFGNSPNEFIALVAILFMILLKMSLIGERLTKLETEFKNFKHSFMNLAKDFKEHIKK